MLIIYTPDGGDRQEFEFDPDSAWSFEAELIESVGRPLWVAYETDFLDLLREGNFTARKALLWVLLRRENPTLRFADLVVKTNEVVMGLDKAERRVMRQRMAAGEFSAAEIEQIQTLLVGYPEDDDLEEPVGKDKPDDSATDGPSPTS
jgi:hypothetical protein